MSIGVRARVGVCVSSNSASERIIFPVICAVGAARRATETGVQEERGCVDADG